MPISSSQLADDVVSVFKRTVTLTNAQIKALPTTPIEIVEGLVGKVLEFVFAMVIFDVQAGVYTNVHADLDIQFAYASGDRASSSVIDPDNSLTDAFGPYVSEVGVIFEGFSTMIGETHGLANVQGQAIRLKAENGGVPGLGDFTGGHAANTVKVVLHYAIIDV